MGLIVDVTKAKAIGHDIRRAARAEEFKPYDDAIAKQIPGQIEGAESARQVIRDKYSVIQAQIEAASSPEEIKAALSME
jgi:hypothetical protein